MKYQRCHPVNSGQERKRPVGTCACLSTLFYHPAVRQYCVPGQTFVTCADPAIPAKTGIKAAVGHISCHQPALITAAAHYDPAIRLQGNSIGFIIISKIVVCCAIHAKAAVKSSICCYNVSAPHQHLPGSTDYIFFHSLPRRNYFSVILTSTSLYLQKKHFSAVSVTTWPLSLNDES